MPCYDGRKDEQNVINAQLVKQHQKKIDDLTNMLCEVCTMVEFEKLPQGVRGWYSRHLDEDRKRVHTLFVDKFAVFSDKVKDMSGKDLREIEEVLDNLEIK